MLDRGEIERRETVVFIHTGGTPLVFQLASRILKALEPKEHSVRGPCHH